MLTITYLLLLSCSQDDSSYQEKVDTSKNQNSGFKNTDLSQISTCIIPNKTLIIKLTGHWSHNGTFGIRDSKTILFSKEEPNNYLNFYDVYFRICNYNGNSTKTQNHLLIREIGSGFETVKFLNLNIDEAYQRFRTSNWGSIFKVQVDVEEEHEYLDATNEQYFFGKILSFSVE